jgi:hypothetical protein
VVSSGGGLIRALGVYLLGKAEEARDSILQKFQMAERTDGCYLPNTLESR